MLIQRTFRFFNIPTMILPMKQIELLAPARDLECGLTAIDCGADAVYIGGPQFGARSRVGNSLDDIARLVEKAHVFGARVYVTLNTLLGDHELQAAVDLIHQVYERRVDGVIIQDMGLLECDLPPISLIASTQTHNTTPERVAFLEQVGFQRVILARELSLDQIKAIRAATSVELEAFVFGALCVGYSGQCLMSYAIGGRSGNRGECAQPCRKRYRIEDAQGRTVTDWRYLLSLRDWNLLGRLGELMDAGVSSFKIEGRLKDRGYVANVVTAFRQELDRLSSERGLVPSALGHCEPGFVPDLIKSFNRGFTDTFLDGRPESPGAIESPSWIGELLGTVQAVQGGRFQLDASLALNNGDGLCFRDEQGQWSGTQVNGCRDGWVTPVKMEGFTVGQEVFRNLDQAFARAVERARPRRSLGVRLCWQQTDGGAILTATDEQGVQSQVEVESVGEHAQNPEAALGNLKRQLGKTGGTVFECLETSIVADELRFWPVRVINQARREVLERLVQVRLAGYRPRQRRHVDNATPYPQATLDYLGNVLNDKAAAFYRRHGVTQIEPAAESGLDLAGRVVMTTKYCLRQELGGCLRQQTESREDWILVDEKGHRYELRFDCKACQMQVVF